MKSLPRSTTFIYALVDPFTSRIRYIGKANDPQHRLRRHINNANAGCVYHASVWIRSLLIAGVKPEIRVMEECEMDDWKNRERYWIKTCRDMGIELTNTREGGLGSSGCHPSEETRAKMRQRHSERKAMGLPGPNKGKTATPEARALRSLKKTGTKHTEETRAKISEGNKGRKLSEQSRDKIRAASIGRKRSSESIAKSKMKITGMNRTAEQRANIKEAITRWWKMRKEGKPECCS